MASYIWELGIDWDAVVGPANASYMPAGFVQGDITLGDASFIRRPLVMGSDQITFRIFDVTQNPQGISIASFTINPRAGVFIQSNNDPLENVQPALPNEPQWLQSTFFGTPLRPGFPCWQADPVNVLHRASNGAEEKFLLNFFVQVRGPVGSNLRTFGLDPEMVVGPNESP